MKDKKTRKRTKKKSLSQPQKAECFTQIRFQDITKIHPALKNSLGYCLFKCTSIFKSQLEKELQSLNINTHHMALLSVLSQEKSSNQNQIGDELGVDKASMVKLIDHLENLKLVERVSCTTDRRVKFLRITPFGTTYLKKISAIRSQVEKNFLSSLSEQENFQLRSSLLKLLENSIYTIKK